MNKNTNLDIVAKPGSLEIVMSRNFDATPELLFRAYTEPKLFSQWWGAKGMTTTVAYLEAKAGGSYRYQQKISGHGEFNVYGIYHSVTAHRIVKTFEADPMQGHVLFETVTFEPLEREITRVITQSIFQSVADRDAMIASGAAEGTSQAYAMLDKLIQEIRMIR
jgi:uncharacterized protein YndB with AHSA1/START domain